MVMPEIPDVELVGAVHSRARATGLPQEQLPISPRRCFSSLEGALDATPADAVLVTTTLPGHAPITRAALDAGLHVLVEKPFTDPLESAQDLVDLSARKGSTLLVSQHFPFS